MTPLRRGRPISLLSYRARLGRERVRAAAAAFPRTTDPARDGTPFPG
ncbi:hypothetical protein [Streptomyces acidicola]|nr:hypothetical protein [Streptomyces acidicola]